MSDKREDYISWDEYFMGVAKLSGMRSKDPHTQVGACIVSKKNKILSMGYNGFPVGSHSQRRKASRSSPSATDATARSSTQHTSSQRTQTS